VRSGEGVSGDVQVTWEQVTEMACDWSCGWSGD